MNANESQNARRGTVECRGVFLPSNGGIPAAHPDGRRGAFPVEFRSAYGYGQAVPGPVRLAQILADVYAMLPIDSFDPCP